MIPNNESGRWPVRRLLVAGAAGTALLAVVLVVLLSSSPPSRAAEGETASSLIAKFAVLRESAGETMPASLSSLLDRVKTRFSLDVEGARRSSSTGAWLIPGNGWMCVAAEDSEGLGMNCVSGEAALKGELALIRRQSSEDRFLVVGAAPDGDTKAIAETSEGNVEASVSSSTFKLEAVHLLSTRLQ